MSVSFFSFACFGGIQLSLPPPLFGLVVLFAFFSDGSFLSDLFCILLRHFLGGFCISISFASTHDDDYDPRPTTKNMVSSRTDDIYGMESRSAYDDDDDDEDVGMGTGMGMGTVEGGGRGGHADRQGGCCCYLLIICN
jgi:hypothetical protein